MSLDRLQESLKRILDESRKRNHRRRNKMNMQMRLNTFPESLAIPWEKLPMEEGGEAGRKRRKRREAGRKRRGKILRDSLRRQKRAGKYVNEINIQMS